MKTNIRITGVMFYYYFVCKRKLWYFNRNIEMESGNEDINIGKILDENSYGREKKHIMIDGVINIDFINNYKTLHEVKKSRSIEEAGHWQLKYYLYYLKNKGVEGLNGVVDYPLLRKREMIDLTPEDEIRIEEILDDIKNIVENEKAPNIIKSKICKKCAYYELCYI